MKTANTYPILKESLIFTADVIKYSEILEKENKKPIALKLMQSGININSFLFQAQTAWRDEDLKSKLLKAKISLEDVIYWLKQSQKSNYINVDNNLIEKAEKLAQEINSKLSE